MPSVFSARIDSNSANNPALNLKGDPALSFEFQTDPNVADGVADQDLIAGDDPILIGGNLVDGSTVVDINGTDYRFAVELTGTLPTQNNQGSGQVPDEFEGSDAVIITVFDFPGVGDSTRLFFMPNEDATLADLDAFGNGAIRIQNLNENPPPFPVCFTVGALILTTRGPLRVEDIAVGAELITKDHGDQAVIWVGESHFSWPGADEKAKPIELQPGALGGGSPVNRMIVSPQHRFLVTDEDGAEVLAPARGLTPLSGVRVMSGKREVRYFHVLLPKHCIIYADGAETESFHPGPMALRSLRPEDRRIIRSLFPGIAADGGDGYGPTARPALTVREAKAIAKHMRRSRADRISDAVAAA